MARRNGRPASIKVRGQTAFFADSRDIPHVKDKTVDFIMTSPPYWSPESRGRAGRAGPRGYDEYLEDLNRVWDECYRVAKDDCLFVINAGSVRHGKRYYPLGFDIRARMRRWELWDLLVWHIPDAPPQPGPYEERLFDDRYEFLMLFAKDGGNTDYTFHKPRVPHKYRAADRRKHKMNPRGRCLGNIIRAPAYGRPSAKSSDHTASYPEELVSLMLHTMTDEGDVVFDPFLGGGTTLKVANAMNRRGVGAGASGDKEAIRRKIGEPFEAPDWRSVDLIHSTAMATGEAQKDPSV